MRKVSKETLIRTGVLILTLTNTILSMFDKNPLPFSENDVYQVVSAICTVAAAIWAWWKNNSFTDAAIKADEYKDALKLQEKREKIDSVSKTTDVKEDELK